MRGLSDLSNRDRWTITPRETELCILLSYPKPICHVLFAGKVSQLRSAVGGFSFWIICLVSNPITRPFGGFPLKRSPPWNISLVSEAAGITAGHHDRNNPGTQFNALRASGPSARVAYDATLLLLATRSARNGDKYVPSGTGRVLTRRFQLSERFVIDRPDPTRI
jgi:hypothetical protein